MNLSLLAIKCKKPWMFLPQVSCQNSITMLNYLNNWFKSGMLSLQPQIRMTKTVLEQENLHFCWCQILYPMYKMEWKRNLSFFSADCCCSHRLLLFAVGNMEIWHPSSYSKFPFFLLQVIFPCANQEIATVFWKSQIN